MVFQGKADRVKKAGVLMGVGAGLRDRYFPHARTYFEYGVSAHYAHSPQHKMGIASLSADACFVKSLRNWRYVDLCTRADRIQKDLSDTRIKQHDIRVSKLWNGTICALPSVYGGRSGAERRSVGSNPNLS